MAADLSIAIGSIGGDGDGGGGGGGEAECKITSVTSTDFVGGLSL